MARTDASQANGWIPEPTTGEVLTRIYETSAVERVARRVQMNSPSVRVPRFEHEGASIVPEGGLIPVQDATLDTVLVEASKFADRFTVSIEDDRDAVVSLVNSFKASWADSYARKLDNACLGVTAASTGPGTDVPFTSVYAAVAAGAGVTALGAAGAPRNLQYEDLVTAFDNLEQGDNFGNLVVVAHPAFAGQLRNLKDASGVRVVDQPLGAGLPTIFGYSLVFSKGARTSATATQSPTGNPLLIVGNRSQMILGVLDGPESAAADFRWEYDEREVKMRARRGFAVADPDAFQVLEKVA